MPTEKTCSYKHCRFNNSLSDDGLLKVGNKYYHKECLAERDEISKAVSFYLRNFDCNANRALVTKTIQTLVCGRNFSTDYVMYMLTYIKDKCMPLNYPSGLYKYAENVKIRSAYTAYKNRQHKAEMPEQPKEVEFRLPKPKIMNEFERLMKK